jgi:GDP-L-fucose synthase
MNLKFWNGKKVLITGAAGFVGSNLREFLDKKNKINLILLTPNRKQLDLCNQRKIDLFFKKNRPNIVLHLAGKNGGVGSNIKYKADFLYENLLINTLIFEACKNYKVDKLVAISAGTSYPKNVSVPISENDFWNGPPNDSHMGYSIAKRTLDTMSKVYRSQYKLDSTILIPSNLYGPKDNLSEDKSTVCGALINKFLTHNKKNKTVDIWGDGSATREFLYIDDLVKIIIETAERISISGPINVGTGKSISIKKLVKILTLITKFKGKINWDKTKPQGQKNRVFNISLFKKLYKFKKFTKFKNGMTDTIKWFSDNIYSN